MQPAKNQPIIIVRGVAGAVLGGVLGWFAFDWLLGQGFYALAIPGALVGFVSGIFSRGVSWINAVVCAVLAATLGIVLEWQNRPFVADDSFGYFVTHLHALTGLTWLMIGLGVVFGFWFGRGRPSHASHSARTESDRDRIE